MSGIIRGTTPTITYEVTSDFDLTTLTEVWFTVSDSKTTAQITKTLTDNQVSVDNAEKTITATFTQEDTLSFKSKNVDVQIRAITSEDIAVATEILPVELNQILKGGVIE